MSENDIRQDLNETFLIYGSNLKPGDDVDYRTFQFKEQTDVALVQMIAKNAEEINKSMASKGSTIPSLFCNPIIQLFQKLEHVVDYFSGEFEIQTKDKKFREDFATIGREFIKGGYFNLGNVYIAYGQDFEDIDRVKFEKDGKDFDLDGTPCLFRLYTRSASKGTFTSVLSKQSGLNFGKDKKAKMVNCDSAGYFRWQQGGKLWSEGLIGMERASCSVEALSKNGVLTPKTENEAVNIAEQFKNFDSFIKREGNNVFGTDGSPTIGKTKIEPVTFMPRETPMAIYEGIHKAFELQAAHLGYAYEFPTQKKERKNAGENYPHQKVVSNVRTCLISNLNYLFDRMRIRFGKTQKKTEEGKTYEDGVIPKDLKIVPANQASAMGLPHIQQGGSFNNFGNRFHHFEHPKTNNYDIRGND